MRLSPFRPCCGQGRQCQKCKDSLHVVNNDVDNYSLEVRSQLNTQVQMCMAYKGPRIETVAYTYLTLSLFSVNIPLKKHASSSHHRNYLGMSNWQYV